MKKACGHCGKIHELGKRCYIGTVQKRAEQRLRAKGAWHRKAEQIKEESAWLCAVCLDQGTYTYRDLETHHIIKLSVWPEGLLEDENLICLCNKHHKAADVGSIGVKYLRELVARRLAGSTPPVDKGP